MFTIFLSTSAIFTSANNISLQENNFQKPLFYAGNSFLGENFDVPPHWSSDCTRDFPAACLPPTLTVSDLPASWQPVLQQAADKWDIGNKFYFSHNYIPDELRILEATDSNGNTLGINVAIGEVRILLASQVPSASQPPSTTKGITYPYPDREGSEITLAATVILNDIDYAWSIDDDVPSGEVDLLSVAIHELGHVVGLGHTLNPNSVMFPYDISKRDLGEVDINNVIDLYGPISPIPNPSQPILLAPIGQGNNLHPTFQWQEVPNSNEYFFQISTNVSFSENLFSTKISQTSLTLPYSLQSGQSYFWRVKASNFGSNSSWSTRAKFIVGSSELPNFIDNSQFTGQEIPYDDIVVSQGQLVHKSWWVLNNGSSTWGNGYQLVFTDGKQMGAPNAVSIPPAEPGEIVEISVDIIAPSETGSHRGYWRLRNPNGVFFGDLLWVQVNINDDSSPAPPSSGYSLRCTDCPATVEPEQSFRPVFEAIVGEGQLIESRGDMLRHKSGELFGAWPHVVVVGNVNAGQPYNFTFYADNPITAPSQEGTYESTWQLWQDGRWVGDPYTIKFEVKHGGGSNHPPNKPTLLEPGDWAASYGDPGYTFMAQQNGDPDGDPVTEYFFELTSAGGNVTSGWISNSSWTPPTLSPNGYEWHVKVRDDKGAESDWSDSRHLTIYDENIDFTHFYFEPLPPNNEIVRIRACVDAPATLKVEVNTANDGSDSGDWHTLKELGVPCFNEIDAPTWNTLEYEAGPHLVRVLARGDGGWANAAEDTQIFTVPTNNRPNSPYGLFPKNDSYMNSKTITFEWLETLRTTSYQLQASTDNGFSSLILNQTFSQSTTTYTHNFSSAHETVYWRVISTGPNGTNESTSSLHIDITPPNSAVASLNEVTTDTQFSVNWSGNDGRAGLRWYHVQFRDGDRPESEWTDWLVNTTKVAEIFQGQPGHKYYFRVRAMDEIGNWENWPSGDGDASTLIDPASAPPSAWWDEAYTEKRNILVLNNDGDLLPSPFPIHVRFDSTTNPTASEIYNASLTSTKGNDVRVVYDNQIELDRFIQNFTESQIDIWFPLQEPLSSAQTDSESYQLYYSNTEAGSPLSSINNVFLPEDDANTIGLWHFQEGSGNVVNDSSGNNHDGNFSNSGWIDGYLSTAGKFNGSNGYVEIGHSEDFRPGTITLEAWIYLTDAPSSYPMIFNKDRYWFRINGDGKLQFMIKAGGGDRTAQGSTQLQQNQWYHVAATYDGSTLMRVYVNGKKDGENTNGAPPSNWNDHPLRIGRSDYNNGDYFPGYIQHARISNINRTSFPYAKVDIPPSTAVGGLVSPPQSGQADLALIGLSTYPNPNGGVFVQAVFENQGDKDTINGFYTDLYLNTSPNDPNPTDSIQFWVNGNIEPGAKVTLTHVIDSLAGLNLASLKTVNGISESSGTLYAQVDSTDVVPELDDGNNISTQGTEVCFAEEDQYEDDNLVNGATLFTLNTSQTHNFHNLDDEDWYTIQLEAGETYTVRTSNLGVNSDTYLYLFDTDGETILASNDDFNGSLASQITWTPSISGNYYVMISHWNPNVSGCGTNYSISFLSGTGDTNNLFLPLIIK